MYRFSSSLIRGTLISRYKRFLVDVELDSGEAITAHCPNTGAMTGCDMHGVQVYLSVSDNPKRKYRHTWEYSSDQDGKLIGINTNNANKVVKDALLNKKIKGLEHYSNVKPEKQFGKSRIDFLLQEDDYPDAYLEVKSVTLAENTQALFPDTVTARGLKHCETLSSIAQAGHLAYLFFCIQREDIHSFNIASHIDPKYAKAYSKAIKNGVKVMVYTCNLSTKGIEINTLIDPKQ